MKVRYLVTTAIVMASMTVPFSAFADDAPVTAPALPTTPDAPPPARAFGAKGQVIFDRLLGYRASTSGAGVPDSIFGAWRSCLNSAHPGGFSDTKQCTNSIWVSPSVDVGIGNGFTLGGALVARLSWDEWDVDPRSPPNYLDPGNGGILSLSLSPRVGYVVPLDENIVFWPRIGGGVAAQVAGTENSGWGWHASAEAGFIFRAGRHVFLNATPEVFYSQGRWGDGPAETHGTTMGVSITAGLGIVLGK